VNFIDYVEFLSDELKGFVGMIWAILPMIDIGVSVMLHHRGLFRIVCMCFLDQTPWGFWLVNLFTPETFEDLVS